MSRPGLVALCVLAAMLLARTTCGVVLPEPTGSTRSDYTVSTKGFDVRLEDGHRAKIYAFSYVRPGAGSPHRPVLFAWNGGPGAASALLNFGFLGPKRIQFPQPRDEPRTVKATDNPLGLLDVADLVFIDPVGTGYSEASEGAAASFYDTEADGLATAQVIRAWLRANDRLSSPIYLLGESFGATRLAVATHFLDDPTAADLHLAGLVLISQTLTLEVADHHQTPNILSYVASLPAFNRIAAYHGILPGSKHDLERLQQQAVRFASTGYLQALYQGRDLPWNEQLATAERLQRFTGISKDYFLAHGLAISHDEFRRKLLEHKGLLLAENDARYAGPAGAGDPFMSRLIPSFESAAAAEVAQLPKPGADARYQFESDGIATVWHFGAASGERPNVRYIEHAMKTWPALKLIIVSGRYDLGTDVGVADYIMRHSDIDTSRTLILNYDAGHVVYTDPACAADLSARLHAFVSGTQ